MQGRRTDREPAKPCRNMSLLRDHADQLPGKRKTNERVHLESSVFMEYGGLFFGRYFSAAANSYPFFSPQQIEDLSKF